MTIRVVPSTVFNQIIDLNRNITGENLDMSYLLRGRYVKIDFTVLDSSNGIILAIIPSLIAGTYKYYIKKGITVYDSGNIISEQGTGSTYVHPSTHPATIIVQDSTHRFVTDEEKSIWSAGVPSSGNSYMPSGW